MRLAGSKRARTEIVFAGALLLSWTAPAWAQPHLSYDLRGLLSTDFPRLEPTASPQQVEPGEQYPPVERDRSLSPAPAEAPRPAGEGVRWSLRVDASIIADSNVANATDADTILLAYDDVVQPVPLDPSLRARSGIAFGASVSAGVDVPVSDQVTIAADAEAYLVEQVGGRTDDGALLVAIGPELEPGGGAVAAVQLVAFQRWYGGETANRGVGIRGRVRQPLGRGRNLSLRFDGRWFESGYGAAFGGSQASVYLSYDEALDPSLTVSLGGYARRDWLDSDRYSNLDLGFYGGLNHYLSADLAFGLSGGLGRVIYDEPVLFFSPEARRDWRYHGSAYLSVRNPIFLGLLPSLTYTYNRNSSSILFYRTDRHRLRFGLSRGF